MFIILKDVNESLNVSNFALAIITIGLKWLFSFYVSIRYICLCILALEFCSSLISRLIRKYDICNGKQVDASNFCQILRCFNHCLLVHQELLSL